MYVDGLNITGTLEVRIVIIIKILKGEFKITDLKRTKFFLSMQIEYLINGIFVHQSTEQKKSLRDFIWI